MYEKLKYWFLTYPQILANFKKGFFAAKSWEDLRVIKTD